MEEVNYIFKGKRFKYADDFIQEFKPTKWSIRKFMAFIKDFTPSEKVLFADHTIEMLGKYHRPDQDTLNFIRQIIDKKEKFGPQSFDDQAISVSVNEESQDFLIFLFCLMKKFDIVSGTGKDLAIILKENFHVRYSLSTIVGKIYKNNEEFRENLHGKTFKYFQQMSNSIKKDLT